MTSSWHEKTVKGWYFRFDDDNKIRDHFMYAPSLHCNIVSHCLGSYTNWSLWDKVLNIKIEAEININDAHAIVYSLSTNFNGKHTAESQSSVLFGFQSVTCNYFNEFLSMFNMHCIYWKEHKKLNLVEKEWSKSNKNWLIYSIFRANFR